MGCHPASARPDHLADLAALAPALSPALWPVHWPDRPTTIVQPVREDGLPGEEAGLQPPPGFTPR